MLVFSIPKMDCLEDETFTRFLELKAAEAKQALKYNPNHFLATLRSNGGYVTVNKPKQVGYECKRYEA